MSRTFEYDCSGKKYPKKSFKKKKDRKVLSHMYKCEIRHKSVILQHIADEEYSKEIRNV